MTLFSSSPFSPLSLLSSLLLSSPSPGSQSSVHGSEEGATEEETPRQPAADLRPGVHPVARGGRGGEGEEGTGGDGGTTLSEED